MSLWVENCVFAARAHAGGIHHFRNDGKQSLPGQKRTSLPRLFG